MKIQDQIIEDAASGLTIQFETVGDGTMRMRLFGECLLLGNRDFAFGQHGEHVGSGTATVGPMKPLVRFDPYTLGRTTTEAMQSLDVPPAP